MRVLFAVHDGRAMTPGSKKQPAASRVGRFLLSIIHFVVSVWRAHEESMRWAVVLVLVLLLLTGELFTKNGLVALLIIIPSHILLNFLEKWLDKHEEE